MTSFIDDIDGSRVLAVRVDNLYLFLPAGRRTRSYFRTLHATRNRAAGLNIRWDREGVSVLPVPLVVQLLRD